MVKDCVVLDDLTHSEAEFHQEAGSFNLESIPSKPWRVSSRDLLAVEANMKSRYDRSPFRSVFALILVPDVIGVPLSKST